MRRKYLAGVRPSILKSAGGALNVKLSDADLKEIASAIPAGAVKGTRYPEAQMASLYI